MYYYIPFIFREEYKQYMGRPDLKQELVSHWQKDFNSIPDDMRQDEDTKAELHHRLDVRKYHILENDIFLNWSCSEKCKC